MHPNRSFAWTDRGQMLDFVSRRGFAHIFTASGAGLHLAHAPLLVTANGHIRFHLFKSNRAQPHVDGNQVLLSIVDNDAYQSPNWYVSEDQVPTWLYEAVEVEGTARRLEEPELIDQVDALSETMESRFSPEAPWTRAKMTPGKFEALLRAIVGFEVEPSSIRGTRKLNQHKATPDLNATIAGQRRAGRDDVAAAIEQVRAR